MRMKNKLIGTALAVTLIAGVAGCSSTNTSAPAAQSQDSAASEQDTQKEADAGSASKDEQQAENAGGQEEPGKESDQTATEDTAADKGGASLKAPAVFRKSEYIFENDESGKYDQCLCEGRITSLTMDDDCKAAFPALYESFTGYFDTKESEANSRKTEFTNDNIEYRAGITPEETDPMIYTASVELDHAVRRLDEKYLSVLTTFYTFSGGAHGYTEFGSLNLDVATGRDLSLMDIVPDRKAFTDYLVKSLLDTYGKDAFFASETEGGFESQIQNYVDNTFDPEKPVEDENGYAGYFVWTLDADGVTVFFNAYDIAPYAYGTITAMIPYSTGLIDSAYVPADDCSIITELTKYMTVFADTDKDGVAEAYECTNIPDEMNEGDSKAFEVSGEKGKVTLDTYFYGFVPYLVRAQGKHFLLVDLSEMNDYQEMYTFSLDNGEVGKEVILDANSSTGYYDYEQDVYYSACLTDSAAMRLSSRMDILSTYSAGKTYHMNEDGSAVSDDKYYIINSGITLKSVKDIEGESIDDEGNSLGSITIPSGSEFSFVRTDAESCVDFKLGDGSMVRIAVEKDEENWGYKIGGVNAEELFEMLYYAG